MNNSAARNYLENDILTATPQKLQLLLINAIVQAGERARKHWLDNDHKSAKKDLRRAREIAGELFNGLDFQHKSELVGKVASVYLFIYQSLARAELHNDLSKLDDALRVLDVERETWRLVCQIQPAATDKPAAVELGIAPLAPHFFAGGTTLSDSSDTSFSLEA